MYNSLVTPKIYTENPETDVDYSKNDVDSSKIDADLQYTLTNLFGINSIGNIIRCFNPASFVKRQVVHFNSLEQDIQLNGSGKLQWSLSYSNLTPATVQLPSSMQRILAIKLAGSIKTRPYNIQIYPLPIFSSSHWFSMQNYNRNKISILIDEFAEQSFIGPVVNGNVSKFHFTLTHVGDEWISESYGQGFYNFHKPYISPTTITMQFFSNWIPCSIYGTLFNGPAIKNGSNTLTITSTVETAFLSAPVYVSRFTTTNPVADRVLIEMINNTLHTNVTVITTPAPYPNEMINLTVVTINVDLSAVTLPTNLVCEVRSAYSAEYIIPIEFYYTDLL